MSAVLSLVVPSGATLGTVNATAARLVLLALDNAGTVELAVSNLIGGLNLDETTLINTTAISSGATSASVIYSTTARTGVPFRVVGFVDVTEATAGVWATAPSTIQGQGGQALSTLSGGVGTGQSWQDMTGSRALATTYTNTTGKPIMVEIISTNGADYGYTQLAINGSLVTLGPTRVAGNYCATICAIIPPGATYVATGVTGTSQISKWSELR